VSSGARSDPDGPVRHQFRFLGRTLAAVSLPTPPSRPLGPGVLGGLVRLAGRVLSLARPVAAAPLALAAPLTRPLVAGQGPAVEIVRTAGDGARIAVFVPPPGSGPEIWQEAREATGATYAERLRDLLGWSTVMLRTGGRPLPEASVALAALLQRTVEQWPVEPERLVLVGYGVGGLVARGAAGLRAPDLTWTDLLSEVVALGTPTYAAPDPSLPGGVASRFDEQLAGIVVGDDRLVDVPLREGVDYLVVSDRVATHPHRLGRLVGEALWWRRKRIGRPRDVRDLFPSAQRFELATAEAPLANHPQVHSALLHWLA
jgi:hypothetical protein